MFFQMQKKLKTCRNLNLRNFGRSFLGDYKHITFISQKAVPQKKKKTTF